VSEEGQGDIAESWKDYPFTPSDVLQIHRKNLVSKNNNKELVIRMGWKKRHFRYTVTTLGGHRAIKLELLDKTRENGSPYTFYYRQSY
ncbi:MAG TPA: hypothetical protein VK826_13170, partial [Bacteroidia bacterium]|nr:hypothetical protein [Bacteroidia bacterium]